MNLNYHIHKSDIQCPYCDKSCYDDDYIVSEDGFDNQIEFECGYCEKKFWVEASVVYSTHADCTLNDKKHVFRNSETHPTFYNCDNCPQYEVRNER